MRLFTRNPGFALCGIGGSPRFSNEAVVHLAFFPASLPALAGIARKDEAVFLADLMRSFQLTEVELIPAEITTEGVIKLGRGGTAECRNLKLEDDGRSLLVGQLDGRPLTRLVLPHKFDGLAAFSDMDQNLALLSEEALEVAGVVHKARRFGLHARSPVDQSNAQERLITELGDFEAVKRILLRHRLLTEAELEAAVADKVKRLQTWYKFPEAQVQVRAVDELDTLSKAELCRTILTEMFGCRSNQDGTYSNDREVFHPASLMQDPESTLTWLSRWILTADWSMVDRGSTPTAIVRLAPSGAFEAEAAHINPAMGVARACLRAYRASQAPAE